MYKIKVRRPDISLLLGFISFKEKEKKRRGRGEVLFISMCLTYSTGVKRQKEE